MLSTLFFYYLVACMIIMIIGFGFFASLIYDLDAHYHMISESGGSCVVLMRGSAICFYSRVGGEKQ
jgi:hypothetical protein